MYWRRGAAGGQRGRSDVALCCGGGDAAHRTELSAVRAQVPATGSIMTNARQLKNGPLPGADVDVAPAYQAESGLRTHTCGCRLKQCSIRSEHRSSMHWLPPWCSGADGYGSADGTAPSTKCAAHATCTSSLCTSPPPPPPLCAARHPPLQHLLLPASKRGASATAITVGGKPAAPAPIPLPAAPARLWHRELQHCASRCNTRPNAPRQPAHSSTAVRCTMCTKLAMPPPCAQRQAQGQAQTGSSA